jgi:hypothetical protein
MTDAKEPAAIAALREVVHPTSVGTVPIVYADILQAWDTLARERDEAVDRGLELQAQLMTMLVQRDEARRDVSAMREMLATAFREGWNCGDWKEDCNNVPSREYDWMHSAVKAKADAALTAALTQEDA